MNRLEKIVVITGLSILVGLTGLAFWPKETPASIDLRIVRIGIIGDSVSYAPFYVAKKEDAFDKAFAAYGYKVKYHTFTNADEANKAFLNEQIDAVFEADIAPAIHAKAAKIPVFIAGVTASYLQEIMLPTSSTLKTIEEMRNRKVIVETGSTNHFNMLRSLSVVGINPDNIVTTPLATRDAIAAMKEETVDAWATSSPIIEIGELSHYMRALPRGEAKTYGVLVVRDAFKAQKAKAYLDLLSILEQSKTSIQNDDVSATAITAKAMDMPIEAIRKAFTRHNWGAKLDEAAVNTMQPFADFMRDQKMIDDSVDIRSQMIKSNLD